jgi:hypothetical protein
MFPTRHVVTQYYTNMSQPTADIENLKPCPIKVKFYI